MLEPAQKLIDQLVTELDKLPLPSGPYSRKTDVILQACRLMDTINELACPERRAKPDFIPIPPTERYIFPLRLSQSVARLSGNISPSRVELLAEAKRLDVKGRSRMRKSELAAAIEAASTQLALALAA